MSFQKYDRDKLKWSKFAWRGATRIMQIFQWGAENKYEWDNWQQPDADISRLLDAAIRHLIARAEGEVNDPESGYDHLAHAGWNILCALEHIALGTGINYPSVKELHVVVDPRTLPHKDSTFAQLNFTTQSKWDAINEPQEEYDDADCSYASYRDLIDPGPIVDPGFDPRDYYDSSEPIP